MALIKFDVLARFSSEVKFTAEIECDENASRSVKMGLAVRWGVKNNADLRSANLSDADLRSANLRSANLWSANLSDANLRSASGLNPHVKCIQIDRYAITYTSHVMQIGCQRHEISEWREFSDAQIRAMDGREALEWWGKYKGWIFQAIELAPADPTRNDASEAAA